MKRKLPKFLRGFTLIEILLVIGIIAILSTFVLVSLNPGKRITDTKNSRRFTDVDTLLKAIHECIIDDNGNEDADCGLTDIDATDTVDFTEGEICGSNCASGTPSAACIAVGAHETELFDLSTLTDANTGPGVYLGTLPQDPSEGTATNTGYTLSMNDGIVVVTSCHAKGQSISATR